MDIESKPSSLSDIEFDTNNPEQSLPKSRAILIVDHDAPSRELLARILRGAGFECLEAGDVATATLALASGLPQAIMLDGMLPGHSGLEYLAMLKQDRRTLDIPLVMMSASATEQDRIAGLNLGADDFIAKPVAALECIARLQAVLRRCARQARWKDGGGSESDALIEYGGLRLDPLTHRVSAGRDKYLRLGPSEFRLLRFFLRHPDRVHGRHELLEQIRGPNPAILTRTVDAYVGRVRRALKQHGCDIFLRTVHGMGYQFSVPGGQIDAKRARPGPVP